MKIGFYVNQRDKKFKPYQALTAMAVNWNDIRTRYVDLVAHNWPLQSMVDLVNHIIHSGISNRVYAYTSMDKLVISIYEDLEYNREALHIQYLNPGKVHFEYFPKPFERSEGDRIYPEAEIIKKFDRYIELLRW